MWCHYCDKTNHNTAKCQDVAKVKQHKRSNMGQRLIRKKRPYPFFLRRLTLLKSYEHYPWALRLPQMFFKNGMSKLNQDLEYVKTYLDDLLILTNNNLQIT
jgi:hypothetical protein